MMKSFSPATPESPPAEGAKPKADKKAGIALKPAEMREKVLRDKEYRLRNEKG